MLADPQSLTVTAAGATSAPRTGANLNEGVFSSADGNVIYTVSHSFKTRTRDLVRVDLSKVAPDPLNAAMNLRYSASAYVVIDHPKVGFTPAELVTLVTGLFSNLTASTNKNLTSVIGGEI